MAVAAVLALLRLALVLAGLAGVALTPILLSMGLLAVVAMGGLASVFGLRRVLVTAAAPEALVTAAQAPQALSLSLSGN
jgi:hypothetical protein